jgi:RNA polymerase sigma factor (sigma-70 family)
MKIDNALIQQWEPKIQKMLSNLQIMGMDRDDIAQELRIAIIKAANAFNKTHGTIFHTYLHTTMVNTIRTLISKAQKRKDEIYAMPLETNYQDNPGVHEGWREVIDKVSTGDWTFAEKHSQIYGYNDIEVEDLIETKKLNPKEQKFLELRQDGMTMEEISKDLGESAYKVRQILREKFLDLADEYKINF